MKELGYFFIAFMAVLFLASCECDSIFRKADCCQTKYPCKNGGVCLDGGCECSEGYEGDTCETMSRYKFISRYKGYDSRDSTPYIIEIKADNKADSKVRIDNFYNANTQITATVKAKKIYFSNQMIDSSRTINATGILNDSLIYFDYTIENTAISGFFQGKKLR